MTCSPRTVTKCWKYRAAVSRLVRRFFAADGSPAQASITLENGESILAAACFLGDLVILAQKSDSIRLVRFNSAGAQPKVLI